MTVAVVIATRNMAATLGKAIDSACHQGPDAVVIVDDASEDETPAVVEHYANQFTCVRYVRHREKTPCHVTALRPVYASLDFDHFIGLGADDILLPGLVTAVRDNAMHAVVFTEYTCSSGPQSWRVSHGYADKATLTPHEVRVRLQNHNATETGIGSSVRSDVMAWLWQMGWGELGPHADSIGYATAAAVFGAVYLPMAGGHIEFNPQGYGQRTAAADPNGWAAKARAFMARAGLDATTAEALIAKRCYGFAA